MTVLAQSFGRNHVYTYEHPLSWLSPSCSRPSPPPLPPHPLPVPTLCSHNSFPCFCQGDFFLNAYLLIITFFWLKARKALSSSRHVLWLPSLVREDLPGLMVPQIYHIPHSLLAILENFGFAVSYKFIPHTCVVLSTWNVAPPFFVLLISTHQSGFLFVCFLSRERFIAVPSKENWVARMAFLHFNCVIVHFCLHFTINLRGLKKPHLISLFVRVFWNIVYAQHILFKERKGGEKKEGERGERNPYLLSLFSLSWLSCL